MNVKPKDLAMVVECNDPDYHGATCTVVGLPKEAMPPAYRHYGHFWQVKWARPMPCHMTNRPDDKFLSHNSVFPDAMLRKIGGPDVDIDTMEFNPLAHEQTA